MSQTKTGDIFKEIGKNMGFVGEKAGEKYLAGDHIINAMLNLYGHTL